MKISIRVEEILNQWDKDWKDLINHDLEEYNFIDIGINNQKYFSYIPYDKLQYFDKLDYTSEDRLKYAVDNDFYMRHSENKYTFYHRDKKYLTQEVDLRLNVDIRNYKHIPYMATFCLHRKDYMATVDFYNWMQNASGGFVYCSKCGKQVDEYAGYYYSKYDYEKNDSIIYCEDCVEEHQILIKGKRYKVTDKHIRYCQECKSWHLEVDTVTYSMCKECWDKLYVKIKGRKYSKKGVKVYYDEESKEWKLREGK